ncbi:MULTISPECIES: SDR family oxidoreductase [unclassified Exiguobacterium]|uniref:SDR family oxidoreductase n=1 Tax=unclassified Exiguobacterium TaxID=2644629 RepID=UPI000B594EFE|nr:MULTISPECIES: SDR family oxidoreductase [unclassified Exiguobacterium]ASI35455.1 oxidoreductase [Exiguobacterium sp. N4-1P]ASI37468.1 oxidoreductase [Exiguobacterium sp. N4-1P]
MAENKVVIITGASSGIGEATAKLLAKNGAKLVLAARREDRLQALKEEIEQLGGQAVYQVTDVTKTEQLEQLAKLAQETYGSVDVLVNNAGLMPLSQLHKNKQDEWDTMVDVNIKGVLYGIGAVLPYMRKQKSGHIINISSVAGHEVMPSSAVYSGTKFAVRAITEGLRKEESVDNNIRATIISPGAVDTELKDHITDEDIKQGIGNMQAIDADAIARAINYAVSEPDDVSINEILIRPTSQK